MKNCGRLALATVGAAITVAYALGSEVHIALRSSWPAPPLLLEIIETIALENEEAFFPALDALTHPDALGRSSPSSSTTPEAAYEFALAVAHDAGLVPDIAAVHAGLALHAAAPRIEAFYAHYRDSHGARKDLAGKESCESWVDWYGTLVCDLETLRRLVSHETIDPTEVSATSSPPSPRPRPKVLNFDHIYPPVHRSTRRPSRTAVLYGAPSSSNFRDLHSYLLGLANAPEPRVEYIFRHAIPLSRQTKTEPAYLSGYGVSLDLKKMEYSAVDDRRVASGEPSEERTQGEEVRRDDVDIVTQLINAYPVSETADATGALTEEELHRLGAQAAQIIADAGAASLSAARLLAQDFPKYTTSLARRVVANQSIVEESETNALSLQPGLNLVWLNGVGLNAEDLNPFALLRLMRRERGVVRALTGLGLSSPEAIDLLTHDSLAQAHSAGSFLDGFFDASDRSEGGDLVMWWNDIEKDSRYSRWRPSIHGILQPLYPGQFHQIRLNLYNIVLAVDMSQPRTLHFLSGAVSNVIARNFPFRWGIVPTVKTDDSIKMARLFKYLMNTYGRAKTMNFIKALAQTVSSTATSIDWSAVRNTYGTFTAANPPSDEEGNVIVTPKFDSIVNDTSDSEFFAKARAYAERLGTANTPDGHAFVNGKHYLFDDDFLRNMQNEINGQLQYYVEMVYGGQLGDTEATSIANFFYDLPTSNKRRNPYIYENSKNPLRLYSLPDLFDRTPSYGKISGFVYPSDNQSVPLTIQVVADLDSEAGLALIQEALQFMEASSIARVAFVHNPGDVTTDPRRGRLLPSTLVSHLLASRALPSVTPTRLLAALGLGSTTSEAQRVLAAEDSTLAALLGGNAEPDPRAYEHYTRTSAALTQQLHLSAGQQALLVNGRVIGPFPAGAITTADLEALASFELRKRAAPVIDALKSIRPAVDDLSRDEFANLISMTSSVIAAVQIPDPTESGLFNKPSRPRQRVYRKLSQEHTGFNVGNNATALYQFGVILDPLSESAQKWTSLLEWLSVFPDVFIDVRLNPAQYQELPLKRFYRYNVLSRPQFMETGEEANAAIVFAGLPKQPIYTLAMDVPISWLVRPRESQHDLDNIQLGHLGAGETIRAVFDLDYLVVEGHARETSSGAPPRGLQLQLTDGAGHVVGDTQVVENLGYLQLKAKPGVFHLNIREGRGREIFVMESVGNEGWDSPTVQAVGDEITVTSFEGLTLYPRFARLPGMEREDVLAVIQDADEDEEDGQGLIGGIVSKITNIFKPKNTTDVTIVTEQKRQADINIFTVASGLLYERFLSIMVLSVLRNTKSTVKFWFIENFLSPSFLEFIPHFATEYGFDYELVTYKWPSWLRAQKEKQRIIWAYKILFLDVLFPLDLKKVIFVDADQIVRTDMKELVDVDLHGAPYGYTPMGDDNTEMEGFRFWKTGYWKDFLRGRPYHISALYVVDLVRFRQIAAGDMLRGQYQQLSADPNSLANLDQDLPNNLQFQVPIHSLHEDWLWCETWCSKERLHRAKTIDLCQNPLTKEPKLARARAIPEWSTYDSEIAQFTRRLSAEGKISSSLTGADVNALAGDTSSMVGANKKSSAEDVDEKEDANKHIKDEL